jgi:hypothetical protein
MVVIVAFNPNTAPSGLGPFSMLPGITGLF